MFDFQALIFTLYIVSDGVKSVVTETESVASAT